MNHTGTWSIQEYKSAGMHVIGSNTEEVAYVPSDEHAKLIASAPRLLAVLKNLENAARASRGGLHIAKYDAILDEARATIAKAEGR